ncbi:hypothetical protein C5167_025326 [Papaver somniferum]|uniref:Uncharacterized protein n=1 Tax=Papaver somniferum TaxID=3469 RepID=A0A4Y7JUX0_PAPSO|nr:hypothetical protein C5167_025326 [Papaver somniferum]
MSYTTFHPVRKGPEFYFPTTLKPIDPKKSRLFRSFSSISSSIASEGLNHQVLEVSWLIFEEMRINRT